MLVFNFPWLVGGLLSSSLLLIKGGQGFGEHNAGFWTHWGKFGSNDTLKGLINNVATTRNKAFDFSPSSPIFGSTKELQSAASTDVKQYLHYQGNPRQVYRDSKKASVQRKMHQRHNNQDESTKNYPERKVESDRLVNYHQNQAVTKNQQPKRENIYNTRNQSNKNRYKETDRLKEDYPDLDGRGNKDRAKTTAPLYDYVISSVTEKNVISSVTGKNVISSVTKNNQEDIRDGADIQRKRQYQHQETYFQNIEKDQGKMVPQNYDHHGHSGQLKTLSVDKIHDTRPKLRTSKNAGYKENDHRDEVWKKIHTALDTIGKMQDKIARHPVSSSYKHHEDTNKREMDLPRVDGKTNIANNGRDSRASHSQYRKKYANPSDVYAPRDRRKYDEISDYHQEQQVTLHTPQYQSRADKQARHNDLHDTEERSEEESDHHTTQQKRRPHETRYKPYQYVLQKSTSHISPQHSIEHNNKQHDFDPEEEKSINFQTRKKSENQHQVTNYKPKYHILQNERVHHEDKYNAHENRPKDIEKLPKYDHFKPNIQPKSYNTHAHPSYHLINHKQTNHTPYANLNVKHSGKGLHQSLNPIYQLHHHRGYSSSKHHPVGQSHQKYPTKNHQKEPKLALHEHHQHLTIIPPEILNNDNKQIILKIKYDDIFKHKGAKHHIHLHHHHHHHNFDNPNKKRSHLGNNDLKGQHTHLYAHSLKHRIDDMSGNIADKRLRILPENPTFIATQSDSLTQNSAPRNITKTITPLNGQTYIVGSKRRRHNQDTLERAQGQQKKNGTHQKSKRQKYYLIGSNQQSANKNIESNVRQMQVNKMHKYPVRNISIVSSNNDENLVNMKIFRSGDKVLVDKRLHGYNHSPKHSWTSTIKNKSNKILTPINQTNINQESHRQQALKQDGPSIVDKSLWFQRLKEPEEAENHQGKVELKDNPEPYEGSSSSQINTFIQSGLSIDPYSPLHRNENAEPPFFPQLKYNQYVKPTEKPVLLYLIGQ